MSNYTPLQKLTFDFGAVQSTDDAILASLGDGQIITPDLVYSLAIDATSEVTQFPVDEGANVTDHVKPKPVTLRLEALFVDSDLDPNRLFEPASADGEIHAPEGVAEAAFKALDDRRLDGSLCVVHTEQREFRNMVLTSLSRTLDKSLTRAVRFTATLQEIRIVQTAVKALERPKIKKAAGHQNLGTQQGADTSDENRTQAHQWFGHRGQGL